MTTQALTKSLQACLVLAVASSAHACLWDSDTIADEAKKFPDLIDVATGRFDRYPPLFYQMRLDRVTKELKTNPAKLDDYDDAGVACTRLGKDDEALRWMAKKRAEMRLLNSTDPDQTYRLLANEGTFYAHTWFRDGKKGEQIDLLDKSLADLKAAVKLNPNAHFGREKVQVVVIEWAKTAALDENSSKYGEPIGLHDALRRAGFSGPEMIKGLSGLVVLGNAWESADVFVALAEALPLGMGTYRSFVFDRVRELKDKGDALQGPDPHYVGTSSNDALKRSVEESYDLFRKSADQENIRMTEYMLPRLKAGSHPDTDANFWQAWKPGTRPDFIDPPFYVKYAAYFGVAAFLAVVTLIVIPLLKLNDHLRVRARQRAERGP